MVTSHPALEAMGHHGEYVMRKKVNVDHFLVHMFIEVSVIFSVAFSFACFASVTNKQIPFQGTKALVALVVVAVIVPLMVGVLMELVIVIPLRVPLHQTPIIFLWQVSCELFGGDMLFTCILCILHNTAVYPHHANCIVISMSRESNRYMVGQ